MLDYCIVGCGSSGVGIGLQERLQLIPELLISIANSKPEMKVLRMMCYLTTPIHEGGAYPLLEPNLPTPTKVKVFEKLADAVVYSSSRSSTLDLARCKISS
jgi:hypothetical protein